MAADSTSGLGTPAHPLCPLLVPEAEPGGPKVPHAFAVGVDQKQSILKQDDNHIFLKRKKKKDLSHKERAAVLTLTVCCRPTRPCLQGSCLSLSR